MKKILSLILIFAGAFNLLLAQNVTVAKWNGYTSGNPPENGIFLANGGIDANNGTATLTRDANGTNFAVNADGVAASQGWHEATTNEKYWITTFSTVGCTNLTFTSRQRGSNTGPKDFKVQYKVGASGSWTDVAGATNIEVLNDNYVSGVLTNHSLPAAMNNQSVVSLRWICTSTVAINGGVVAAGGVNRLDITVFGDVQITSPVILVNPSTLNFGTVETGTTSVPQTINVSGAMLTGAINYSKSGADAAAFTVEETSWNPTTGGTLSVTFAPAETRNYTASLTFSSTGATDVVVPLSGAGIPPEGQAIAKWNGYTSGNPPENGIFLATGGNAANNGVATLTRDAAGAGYAVNADGVAASTGWQEATTNEKYWITTFSTVGCTNLTFTSKQRGSNTGPKDFKMQYKIGAGSWTDVAGATIVVGNDNYVSGVLANYSLPAAMNNQSAVSLRWLCTSTDAIGGGVVAATGVNRLDITVYGQTEITSPVILVNPSTLNFGTVEPGTVSVPKTINVSGAMLTGNITYSKTGADAAAFTIEETSWNSTTGGTLSVTFAPAETRNYTASLTFSSTGATDVTVPLSGAGAQPTGQLIAKWNGYESGNPPEDGVFLANDGSAANNGIAVLTRDAAGTNFAVNNDGVAASQGWAEATTDEKYWITTFSTVGFANITFTSKQKGSNTGPKDFKVQYQVGASGTWTDVAGTTIEVANDNYISGVLTLIDLPQELSHQEAVSLRWLCTSTVAINGLVVAAGGVNRLDITVYGVPSTPPFVPVTNIINVPAAVAVGTPKLLTGTVIPANATNKTIVWSVKEDGGTGATINNNVLNTTNIGTIEVTATIINGTAIGEDFTKDFTIEIIERDGISNNAFDKIELYSHQNSIFIKNVENPLSVEVLDMIGRLVYHNRINNAETITLQAQNGIYLVRLISQEGKTMSKKVSIIK